MVLIFYAFGRELAPFRKTIERRWPITANGLRGFGGIARGVEFTAIATGIGPARANDAAERALAAYPEVDMIITVGVAGALSPNLEVGDIVVASRFVLDGGDAEDRRRGIEMEPRRVEAVQNLLNELGFAVSAGCLLTSGGVVASADEKREARFRHSAIAVDMESAAIALAVASRDLPLICIRSIMDTAADNIFAGGLSADGRIRPLKAAGALLKEPASILRVPRLLRNLTVASRTLGGALEGILGHLK
jgi:adenosylhomocysteine nucleosidase